MSVVDEGTLFNFAFDEVVCEYAKIMKLDENKMRLGLWGLDFWESVPDVAGTDFVSKMTDGKFAGTEDLKKYFLTNALQQIDERKAFMEKAWKNKG